MWLDTMVILSHSRGRVLAQAMAGTQPCLLRLAQWGSNLSLCLPRCLLCGGGWMDLVDPSSQDHAPVPIPQLGPDLNAL